MPTLKRAAKRPALGWEDQAAQPSSHCSPTHSLTRRPKIVSVTGSADSRSTFVSALSWPSSLASSGHCSSSSAEPGILSQFRAVLRITPINAVLTMWGPQCSFIHASMVGSRRTAPLNRSNCPPIVAHFHFRIYVTWHPHTRNERDRSSERALTERRIDQPMPTCIPDPLACIGDRRLPGGDLDCP